MSSISALFYPLGGKKVMQNSQVPPRNRNDKTNGEDLADEFLVIDSIAHLGIPEIFLQDRGAEWVIWVNPSANQQVNEI